jgi:hypothetical protein
MELAYREHRKKGLAIAFVLLWAFVLLTTMLHLGTFYSKPEVACAAEDCAQDNVSTLESRSGIAQGPVLILSTGYYTTDYTTSTFILPDDTENVDFYITSASNTTGSISYKMYHGAGVSGQGYVLSTDIPVTATTTSGGGSSVYHNRDSAMGRAFYLVADVAVPTLTTYYTSTIYAVYR